jgi:hypothetical protein
MHLFLFVFVVGRCVYIIYEKLQVLFIHSSLYRYFTSHLNSAFSQYNYIQQFVREMVIFK